MKEEDSQMERIEIVTEQGQFGLDQGSAKGPMRLMLASINKGKVQRLRDALYPDVIIIEPAEYVDVPEDHSTALENARAKASAYSSRFGVRAIATDEALYFTGVVDADQPGLNVRRIPGFAGRPTDQQVLGYYVELITKYGGTVIGRWEFAFSVADPDGRTWETVVYSKFRIFTNQPCIEQMEGYPLSSIQLDPITNAYIAQRDKATAAASWSETYKEPVRKLLESIG
jgi:hypothetical protein